MYVFSNLIFSVWFDIVKPIIIDSDIIIGIEPISETKSLLQTITYSTFCKPMHNNDYY